MTLTYTSVNQLITCFFGQHYHFSAPSDSKLLHKSLIKGKTLQSFLLQSENNVVLLCSASTTVLDPAVIVTRAQHTLDIYQAIFYEKKKASL